MHRVFFIPELVEMIVDMITAETEEHRTTRRRSFSFGSCRIAPLDEDTWSNLKTIGLVCKAFREPCLNRMWHTQISLIPLLRVVDIVHEIPCTRPSWPIRRFKITRSIQRDDIPRMLKYSKRIKKFKLSSDAYIAKEYTGWAADAPPAILFPQLRVLETHEAFELPFILHAMGGALVNLVTTSPISDTSANELAEKSAVLQTLKVVGSIERITQPMCTVIQKAKHLQNIDMTMRIDEDVWQYAAQLCRLKHFNAYLLPFHENFTFKPATFFALVNLSFCIWDTSTALDMMKATSFPVLQSLACTLVWTHTKRPRLSEAAALFGAIASCCSPMSLTSLEVWYEINGGGLEGIGNITSVDLRPLLSLSGLRKLWLDVGWSWELDDQFIQEMANAWQEIIHIYLDPDSDYWSPMSRITYRSLEVLALRCPRLVKFGAVLDITPPSLNTHQPLLGKWNTSLRELFVGQSSIESPELVAAFLSGLFPSIQTIQAYSTEWPNEIQAIHGLRWSRVADIVPTMIEVRQQERRAIGVPSIS